MDELLLYMGNSGSTYTLLAVAGGVMMVLLAITAFIQKRNGKKLSEEIEHLASLSKHGVEHEVVLKAMKLSTWKLDANQRTITFDSDFRQLPDAYTSAPNTPISEPLKLICRKDHDRVEKSFLDICDGKIEEFHEQYQMHMPHSDRIIWEESYATVAERDSNGHPITVVGTSTCIEEKKKLEQELIEARNKAEESDLLKSAFIANMSHEVRTPLNAIVGFSDILSSITDEEERQSIINIIKENNQKLLRIFEDMMNMSEAEASGSNDKLSVSDADAVELLMAIKQKYVQQNRNENIKILEDISLPSMPIHTDVTRLRHIVEHYIDNALKFTAMGSITLSLQHKGGMVTIAVADTGCGVPDEDKERIFNSFVKLDSFVQGAGLGLSVCRSYAISLGGSVGVESKVGVGSRFWVKIPESI